MTARTLWSIVALLVLAWPAEADFVEFNASFQSLPYSEAGLTFSTLPGTNSAVIGSGGMTSGTNFTLIHIRATADRPFSLVSLTIPSFSRKWRIESSSGAVVALASTGVTSFAELSGWTNISYFDLVHNPAEANGGIRVDRVEFAIDAGSLLGDFTANGQVDAADYVMWRSKIRTASGYAAWRANYGIVSGGEGHAAVVPEPAAIVLVGIAMWMMAARGR